MNHPHAGTVADSRHSPAQRRIALVAGEETSAPGDERTQHAMRLLDTMLWVLKGTTRESWATAPAHEADIVVVHRGADPGLAAIWKSRGKLVVEIATENDTAGDDEHVLAYPFPATRVLELLEKLSARLGGNPVSTPAQLQPLPSRSSPAEGDRWNLPEALRTLREVSNDSLWMVARDGADPVVWLRGDGSVYFATESFVKSLRTDAAISTRLELRNGYPPPKTRVLERPGLEFFWYAGFNASDIIAPWLNATRCYRLKSWPDFGVIRPDPAVLRVVALLATEPMELLRLAARARVPITLASRVCNALSLCEVLVAAEPMPLDKSKGASPIAAPQGGFAGFLRRLRNHLGLEAAS